MESIQLDKVLLVYDKKNKKWNEKNNRYEIDQIKVISFLNRLKKLSFEQTINTEKLSMNFKYSFILGLKNNLKKRIEIGEKQLFSEKFYVRYISDRGAEEVYLVKDESPQKDPIPDDLFRINPYKRYELINFVQGDIENLIKASLFNDRTIKNVLFEKKGGVSYSIDIEKKQVNSPTIHFSKFQTQKIVNWFQKFKNISGDKVIKASEFEFDHYQSIGRVIITREKKKQYLSIFISKDRNNSYLAIKDSEYNDILKLLDDKKLSVLFPHSQDFIDKKIISLKFKKFFNVRYTTQEMNNILVEGRVRAGELHMTGKEHDRLRLKDLTEITKILLHEADYINYGNEMTILPEKTIRAEIDGGYYEIGQAHGIIEIFDIQNKISFFHKSQKFNDFFEKVSL